MKNTCTTYPLFLSLFIFFTPSAHSQMINSGDSLSPFKTISAGTEYKASPFFQWLWGKNYRKDWITPVKVPVLILDTAKGGIIPQKAAGGNQTKSLQLKTKADKEYTLRSVNKTLGKVLPKDFLNTFIEATVNDKVSMSHPYAAGSVPLMAQSAHIPHSNPVYVYLPAQTALDTFNKKFGNDLYLFEQRLDGDWKDANNLGNFEKFIDTEDLLKKILDDNDIEVDQRAFVKVRLFDMFINDWDRHEKQWGWGLTETKDKKIYTAVPKDRDQAYFKYDGVILKLLIGASGLKYFQSFSNKLPDVKNFNYEERNLDRFFTNRMTLYDWQSIAHELQQSLPDDVIEQAVKQMPPEIYAISGSEIISKLKSRRSYIEEEATTYYFYLAKQVDVAGSKKNEKVVIDRGDSSVTVSLNKMNKDGQIKGEPFYSRTFKSGETDEVRIYGIAGNDSYTINGNVNNGIKIRIIGGVDKDTITNLSKSSAGKVQVYDNTDNVFKTASNTRRHLSADTTINSYKYGSYLYDKRGIKPIIFYDDDDRLYAGLGYGIIHNSWRKLPFAYKQNFEVRYSISQKAFRFLYNGTFTKVVGKWDLALKADYDIIKWKNFYGLGNETKFTTKDLDFNRMRTEEFFGSAGLNRKWNRNNLLISGFFQTIKLINDSSRFIAKSFRNTFPVTYTMNDFAGVQASYATHHVNDSVLPTKGYAFFANAAYTHNLNDDAKSFARFAGDLHLFVPLISKFSLAIRVGSKTLTGDPEFYQYNFIGGGQTLRGYRRERFWGKTTFYNSNELRYISKVKSYLFNGKAGLVAFFDNGKVWMPSQKSSTLHTGYGGGVVLSPYNKIAADITYSISEEIRLVQIRIFVPFK